MNHAEQLQTPEKSQPQQKVSAKKTYPFDDQVNTSRTITMELPANAPVGLAQIIVLFPDAPMYAVDGERVAADQPLSERRLTADGK